MKEARFAWMAAIVVTVLAYLAGTVRADWASMIPLGSQVAVTVDEYGHGFAAWHDSNDQWVQLPWDMLQDPGPGGLSDKLTYSLMDPESTEGALVEGDVLFCDKDNKLQDVMRFNFYPFKPKPFNPNPGTIVLYSSNIDATHTLADSDLPREYHGLAAVILGGVTTYHPDGPIYQGDRVYSPAWPGYVPGYDVTYYLSDIPLVPVPGAAVLAALGLGLVGWTKRRQGRTPPG